MPITADSSRPHRSISPSRYPNESIVWKRSGCARKAEKYGSRLPMSATAPAWPAYTASSLFNPTWSMCQTRKVAPNPNASPSSTDSSVIAARSGRFAAASATAVSGAALPFGTGGAACATSACIRLTGAGPPCEAGCAFIYSRLRPKRPRCTRFRCVRAGFVARAAGAVDDRRDPQPPVHRLAAEDSARQVAHGARDDLALHMLQARAVAAVEEVLDARVGREPVRVLAVAQENLERFLRLELDLAD